MADPFGNGGYLPYTQDLDDNMGMLRKLIASTQSSTPQSQDLDIVRSRAMNDASRRGLGGPLAQRMTNEATNNFQLGFEKQRFDRLNQLISGQSQMGMQLQDREAARRDKMAQEAAARRAALTNRNRMLAQLLGTGIGAGVGLLGGPAGVAAGGGIGAGVGGVAGQLLFPGDM